MPPPSSSPYVDNFVSQDQINTLLRDTDEYVFPDGEDPLGDIADFINIDEIDLLLGDDDDEDEDDDPEPHREDEMSEEQLPEIESPEDEELSMISMDDIQRVLSEDTPEDSPLEALSLEEIVDSPEEGATEGDGELISQEDIDRLLKNSGVEADEAPGEFEDAFQISREEIDTILTDTREDASATWEQENQTDPSSVPLAETDDEDLPPQKKRSKKKWLLVVVGFLLLFSAGGVAGWVYLMAGDEQALSTSDFADSGEAMGEGQTPVTTGEPQVVSRLENFLIPAAVGNDYAFISLNVVLTIRGVAKDPLAGYETFFRKRIYDELLAKLASISGEKPVERDLRKLVRKTAGGLLTEGVIDHVTFEAYQLM
ncbi:hypothetical protein [Desulfoluna sp.]|uniref:hypothetical protein n=1 Tax=Desulfoluna sp. TaxID=2045199 RepID=UPI002609BBA0|nr:hypothetical protein [Desulfoluna sp.]